MIGLFVRANELGDTRREVVDSKVGQLDALEVQLEVRLGNGRCATGVGGSDGVAVLLCNQSEHEARRRSIERAHHKRQTESFDKILAVTLVMERILKILELTIRRPNHRSTSTRNKLGVCEPRGD